jgi:hypothetical protein
MPFGLYKPDSQWASRQTVMPITASPLERGTKLALRVSLCQGMIATCWTC